MWGREGNKGTNGMKEEREYRMNVEINHSPFNFNWSFTSDFNYELQFFLEYTRYYSVCCSRWCQNGGTRAACGPVN